MIEELSIVMYLSIRRNKNLEVRITLFCRDLQVAVLFTDMCCQVAMIVENNLPLLCRREEPNF